MTNPAPSANLWSASERAIEALLRARFVQAVGVAAAVCLVVALHAHNDGLWFQGDAPRHAANGFFWWDLLRALPTDPLTFTLRYYARYPVIAPLTYPPLFYIVEGLGFQIVAPSALTPRLLVAGCAVALGLYTCAWARRWIGPLAGWSGALVAFVPAIVLWTNAVMLNVPATALGMACLYHFRRWLETSQGRQLGLAVAFFAAGVLTYYQNAALVVVGLAWMMFAGERGVLGRMRWSWLAAAALLAMLPLALAVYAAPVQLARHFPTARTLLRFRTWTYYWSELPSMTGVTLLAAGAIGLVIAFRNPRFRRESRFLVVWIAALIVCISPLPARDTRYVLLVAPAFVLAAALGLAAALDTARSRQPLAQAVMIAALLAAGFWIAARVDVPRASGFRAVAEYVRDVAPSDTVLYDGRYDGVFGFYVRAMDPRFEQRIVRGDKFLYDRGPTTTFRPVEITRIRTPDEIVDAIASGCGCRWVVIEVGSEAAPSDTARLLRRTLARPEFELRRSFAVEANGVDRVDVYRVAVAVRPVDTIDLRFPAFTTQTFRAVAPITR